jgi:putative membrane protein
MNMKKRICFALCLAAFAWSACNNSDSNNSNMKTLTSTDKYFILNAANANRAEIDIGQLAVANATSRDTTTNSNPNNGSQQDSVKAYAQMMVDDHTQAQNELQTIANDWNVTLSSSLDAQHTDLKNRLSSMKGMAFDTAYIQSQIADHQTAITFFESEVNHGTEKQILNYANKYLPILRMHLQQADSIARLLNGGSNSNDTTNNSNPH